MMLAIRSGVHIESLLLASCDITFVYSIAAFGVIKRDRSHGRLVSGSGQKGVLTKLSCGMQGDVTTSSRG